MSVTSDKAIVQNKTKLKMTRMYFGVMKKAGYNAEDAKKFAKEAYKVEHFSDIETGQLALILNKLENGEDFTFERW